MAAFFATMLAIASFFGASHAAGHAAQGGAVHTDGGFGGSFGG